MGKTRDLFKKIRDTKGIFHAKMGSIKDRNGMDLPEAEDIKKRWQEYTEELYKKDLHDPDNHDSIIPSKEIPGLISFRMDWLDLLAVQETRVATREESGVLGFPSRRGLTPRASLECNPEIPAFPGEEH